MSQLLGLGVSGERTLSRSLLIRLQKKKKEHSLDLLSFQAQEEEDIHLWTREADAIAVYA